MAKTLTFMQGCELCNVGVVKEVDKLKERGMKEAQAYREIAAQITQVFGEELFSEQSIKSRYLRLKGKVVDKRRVKNTEEISSEKDEKSSPRTFEEKPELTEEQLEHNKKMQDNDVRWKAAADERKEEQVRKAVAIKEALEFFELQPLSRDILELVYKYHAKYMHPDLGGSAEDMQKLNEGLEALKETTR